MLHFFGCSFSLPSIVTTGFMYVYTHPEKKSEREYPDFQPFVVILFFISFVPLNMQADDCY